MVSSSVLYVFASNQSDILTHISTALCDDTYSCLGCREEMIVVKGDVIAHHFRHNNAKCSYESYLHNTAKNAFYNTFIESAKSSRPITLELKRPVFCTSQKIPYFQNDSVKCVSSVEANYNLLDIFSSATLEQYDNQTGLTPDVMLSNQNNDQRCYVEICVTHKCTDQKIETEIPIIEIEVNCEEDILYIQNGTFSIHDSNLTLYNFNVKEKAVNTCHKDCTLTSYNFEIWTLSKSGHLNKSTRSFSEVTIQELKATNCWPTNLENKIKSQKIKELVFSLDPQNIYSNCLKCIHSSGWDEGKIYCVVNSKKTPYIEAKMCRYYEVDL